MTNFRKSLTLTLIGAGLCFSAVLPALSSDLDDMLKKYPQLAPGDLGPSEITTTEARMMNAIRRHISKLYGLIGSNARSGGRLTAVQAADFTDRVGAIEDTIKEMNDRPKFKYDGAPTGPEQLSYGDMATLVNMVGQTEADLGDALAPKKAKNAPANAPNPPAVSLDSPPPPVKEVGPHYGTPSSRLTYGGGPRKNTTAPAAPVTRPAAPATPAPGASRPSYPSYQARPVQKRFDETFRSPVSNPSKPYEGSGGDSRFQQLFNAK
ncbi:MAG: hypothetical protein K2W95_26795 [Candidatus Obscuribacterales bacterium]|nr:hypothetical protein [Candidatus Obscuribacterales bacterium]